MGIVVRWFVVILRCVGKNYVEVCFVCFGG